MAIFNGTNWIGGIFKRALGLTQKSYWNSWLLSPSNPVLVDMNQLFDVYQSCPHLAMTVNKRAEMLCNGVLKVRKVSDKTDIPNHKALIFMRQPNPLQNTQSFIMQWSIYFDIYGNTYTYKPTPFKSQPPSVLWNIPSGIIRVVPTGKWFEQTSIEGIIKEYQLTAQVTQDNVVKIFMPEDIVTTSEGLSYSILKADSKLIPLQLPISNIIGALKTQNIFLYYGPKQLISSNSKDSDGGIPLDFKEKDRLQKQFNQVDYGINDSQASTVITDASLTVQNMSYPSRDLMLLEGIESDFGQILGSFGVKRDIFPSTKGATNENMNTAEKSTYYSTIIPHSSTFCGMLNKTGLIKDGEDAEFYMDFDHLPVMQDDLLNMAQEQMENIKAYDTMYRSGIISKEQYAQLANVIPDGTGVISGQSATASTGGNNG